MNQTDPRRVASRPYHALVAAEVEGDLAAAAASLLELADDLADRLARAAGSRTSLACQHAMLRAIGVSGLAPNGRPLAHEVLRRFAADDRRLLRTGVALPFALAAHEYDLEPQELATEVTDGHVDLAGEAALLRERSRSGPARLLLEAWLDAADDRLEANRVARAELASLFGEPASLCVAAEARPFDAREAAADAASLVEAGADLVRVRVPRDGELRDDLGATASEDEWPVGRDAPPPAGSQRGLALLRGALDEAGARNGRYARLAARRVGLAAPELAVVAGFERIDTVFVDPMDAIVDVGVDPDRAFTDHAIADALLLRSGARLALGAGPLVGGGGSPSPADLALASGRALALQALSRSFALRNGFPADRVDLGAIPAFAIGRDTSLGALVEISLRTMLFPGHRLVVDDQAVEACGPVLPALLATWMAAGAPIGMVVLPGSVRPIAQRHDGLRGAVRASLALSDAHAIGPLRGAASEGAAAVLAAALETLRQVDRSGLAAAVGRDGWLGAEGLEPVGPGDLASAWARNESRRTDEPEIAAGR